MKICALLAHAEDEDAEKEVYLPVAEASGHAWRAVESAVRRTAKLAWKTDPEKVQVLAGYTLDHRTTAGQFLEMLYNGSGYYVREKVRFERSI